MPYKTSHHEGKRISYMWNNIFSPIENIKSVQVWELLIKQNCTCTLHEIHTHLANIDSAIFRAVTEYFHSIDAHWCNLPITTLMISSPGEVYAGKTLNYTTDTLPIELDNRFGVNKKIFLSESSQLYLELALSQTKLEKVFSIYNSFRKEKSDFSHLTEFQHIEFEWKVEFQQNIEIFSNLFKYIAEYLFVHNENDLLFFLSPVQLAEKQSLLKKDILRIKLRDALDMLYEDTWDEIYKQFSLKHFGSWEEIRLSELLESNYIVYDFPMLQIPFYHDIYEDEVDGHVIAKNADMILYGYREVIGSGQRIRNKEILLKKAEIFKLPPEDYLPYLTSRDHELYQTTSGFGLWWQRLVHWFTNQPMIGESTLFPRTHLIPNP